PSLSAASLKALLPGKPVSSSRKAMWYDISINEASRMSPAVVKYKPVICLVDAAFKAMNKVMSAQNNPPSSGLGDQKYRTTSTTIPATKASRAGCEKRATPGACQ